MRKAKTSLGKVHRTERGFQKIEFVDLYGSVCSVQQSSIALSDKPGTGALWLGVSNPQIQIMASDAKKLGIPTKEETGWISYPIPNQAVISGRMHLDKGHVKALVKHMKDWLKTGSLKEK
jgi:hypothetical protein